MIEDWISITEAAARLTQSGDKVDRSTLSRYLKQHAEALPLLEDGKSNKVEYSTLVQHRSENIRIRSAPKNLFRNELSFSPPPSQHINRDKTQANGNARKALAEAEIKEMSLAERRGELTVVSEVDRAGRDAIALMQGAFERAIESEAASLSLRFGWDERASRVALKGFVKVGLTVFNEHILKEIDAMAKKADAGEGL